MIKFTDGNGASTNGVAITVYEEIPTESHEMKDFMKNLRELRAKRAAARIVCRWWKKFMESHKKTKVRRGGSFSLAFSSLFHSDSESSLSCFSEEHRISNEARKLGKESFQAMKESDTMGDTLIVERCYVMVGGDQSEQFLHLRLLQNMIQMEQEVSPIKNETWSLFRIILKQYSLYVCTNLIAGNHKANHEKTRFRNKRSGKRFH